MKTAPVALAIGLFFVAGIAGGAYWRTVGIGPAAPERSAELPPAPLDRNPITIAAEPARPPAPSDGASMTAPPAAVAPQPKSPRQASQSPAQQPATRRPPAQQASAAAPVHDATGTEDAADHPEYGSMGAPNPILLPATKPAPAPQERVATVKPQPARPHGAVRGAGRRQRPVSSAVRGLRQRGQCSAPEPGAEHAASQDRR